MAERKPRPQEFKKGNPGGKGGWNGCHAVRRFREAVLKSVTEEEIHKLTRALLKIAMAGDVVAAKELLLRLCGPAEPKETKGEGGSIHVLMLDGPHPRFRRIESTVLCPQDTQSTPPSLPSLPPPSEGLAGHESYGQRLLSLPESSPGGTTDPNPLDQPRLQPPFLKAPPTNQSPIPTRPSSTALPRL